MNKQKIFISSVQLEFAQERQMLNDYISTDALLGRFFEPFIFENLPAADSDTNKAYLEQVRQCGIYLGIFGIQYGNEDSVGMSPTAKEFDLACSENKPRLIFVNRVENNQRNPKMLVLIKKAEAEVMRKKFSSPSELKTAVYAALVNYLEEKEFIRTVPFDATVCRDAGMDDIDNDKIVSFVQLAKSRRGFPLTATDSAEKILTHLNLIRNGGLTHAALLLFGKQPQKFIISAEIKCAQFHDTTVSKPVPAYQVYKGDVFQQVNLAVDFVLSRINVSVGTRDITTDAPIDYELPPTAVTEAIVNAVAHRDYTSTAAVQVMLFKDRLEIWNPGHLPIYLSLSKLKQPHSSFPSNPLLAEPMYLSGYIERLGTGILDMVSSCLKAGLKEPEFEQEEVFKAILWRNLQATEQVTPHVTDYDTDQVTDQATDLIKRLIMVIANGSSRQKLMQMLDLKHNPTFRDNYLNPAMKEGYIEMTVPDAPNSPNQKYRLTAKGKALQQQLKNKHK